MIVLSIFYYRIPVRPLPSLDQHLGFAGSYDRLVGRSPIAKVTECQVAAFTTEGNHVSFTIIGQPGMGLDRQNVMDVDAFRPTAPGTGAVGCLE
jgi:hypothetical protein